MARPLRRKPSSIDRLDPEIKDLIGKLRIDRGYTIDEIREQLTKMLDAEHLPSRSALGRHVKSLEEIGAQLRQSREVAQALVAQVGDAPEDKVSDLNIELMHSMVLRMVTATNDEGDGQPITFGPMEMMLLSKTLQQLSSTRKTNTDLILRIRKEAAAEAAKAVDVAAKKVQGGLTRDTIDTIKREILGVTA